MGNISSKPPNTERGQLNQGVLYLRPSQFHPERNLQNWLLFKKTDLFLEKCIPYFKGTLYDFGCGERPYEPFFLQFVDKYVGIDWSNTIHELKADIVADLNKPLPVESEVADIIFCWSVMEHLNEPQTMLDEAFRILKNKGTIILQVPWQWWVHEAPYDFYRFTPYSLKYILTKSGFNHIIIEAQSGFFTMIIVKLIYFTTRFIIGPKPLKWLIKCLLIPLWAMGQILAQLLDNLDKDWHLESTGYTVIAKKP